MMIERIARAMCSNLDLHPDDIMPNGGPLWRYYVLAAQTALMAILEPTPAMVQAAYKGYDKYETPDPEEAWRRMVTAAIVDQRYIDRIEVNS